MPTLTQDSNKGHNDYISTHICISAYFNKWYEYTESPCIFDEIVLRSTILVVDTVLINCYCI